MLPSLRDMYWDVSKASKGYVFSQWLIYMTRSLCSWLLSFQKLHVVDISCFDAYWCFLSLMNLVFFFLLLCCLICFVYSFPPPLTPLWTNPVYVLSPLCLYCYCFVNVTTGPMHPSWVRCGKCCWRKSGTTGNKACYVCVYCNSNHAYIDPFVSGRSHTFSMKLLSQPRKEKTTESSFCWS